MLKSFLETKHLEACSFIKKDSTKGVLVKTWRSFQNMVCVKHPRKSAYITTITEILYI